MYTGSSLALAQFITGSQTARERQRSDSLFIAVLSISTICLADECSKSRNCIYSLALIVSAFLFQTTSVLLGTVYAELLMLVAIQV